MKNGKINNAMLFRLNTFTHMAKQEKELLAAQEGVEIDDWECLKWRAKFRYNLIRNIGKDLIGEERDETIKEVEKAFGWIVAYCGAMKIPVWQVIYNRR